MAPLPQMQAECSVAVNPVSSTAPPVSTAFSEVDSVTNLLFAAGSTGVLLYTLCHRLSPQANLARAATLLRETEAIVEDIRKQDAYHTFINNPANKCVPLHELERDLEEYVIPHCLYHTTHCPLIVIAVSRNIICISKNSLRGGGSLIFVSCSQCSRNCAASRVSV